MSHRITFIHFRNDDGTFDSICPDCCLTAATKVQLAEIEQLESAHVCDQRLVRQVQPAELWN